MTLLETIPVTLARVCRRQNSVGSYKNHSLFLKKAFLGQMSAGTHQVSFPVIVQLTQAAKCKAVTLAAYLLEWLNLIGHTCSPCNKRQLEAERDHFTDMFAI